MLVTRLDFQAFDLHGLELFLLFLGEDVVQTFDTVDSVVQQCGLGLENACFGGNDFLVVVLSRASRRANSASFFCLWSSLNAESIV